MSYQLEFRHLHYFAILAEELHFRKAADRLFISQPGLSKQIKFLEEKLGVKLLERNNRNVALTQAGEFLSEQIRQLDDKVDEIIHVTRLIHTGQKGNLRIGYIGSAMQTIIPDLLKAIDRDFPGILFDLSEMGNSMQIEKLLHQNIDLGFVRADYVPKPLKAVTAYEDTFSLVFPNDYPVTDSKMSDISFLKDEKFILFESSYSQSYYLKVMQIFNGAGFNPKVAHHTIHGNSIFRLVESGFGIAIIPTSLKLGYDLNVKFVELVGIHQKATLKAVWNSNTNNPVVSNVVELLTSHIREDNA